MAVIKFLAYIITESMGILAVTFDSFEDFILTFTNFILLKKSYSKATNSFPYGFGKIQAVSGLIESGILFSVAVILMLVSVRSFFIDREISNTGFSILVLLIATAGGFYVARILKSGYSTTSSNILHAEFIHYGSDAVLNGAALLGILVYKLSGLTFFDSMVGVLISIWIIKEVFELLKNSLFEILDRSIPVEELEKIKRIVYESDGNIKNIHNLKARKAGHVIFIEFHLELPKDLSFIEAHDITEKVENKVKSVYPLSEIIVHAEPA